MSQQSRAVRIIPVTLPPFHILSPVNSHRGRALSACGIVMVFGYEAGVVLFAVGMGAFTEPIFMARVVAVLALREETAFPHLVSTLPTPFAICLRGAGLLLPGVVPDFEPLLDVVGGERGAGPLVVYDPWGDPLVGIGGRKVPDAVVSVELCHLELPLELS